MLEEFEVAVGNELQDSNLELLELVEAYCLGQLRRYKRGQRLYWQGDPAVSVFVVKSGKVKTFCISPEGKALTYEILGKGRLAGATAYLLDQAHQSTAEALEETEAYAVPLAELEQLLVNSPSASMAALRQLAQTVRAHACKVQDITFFDVQKRLKLGLVRLASQYGQATDQGIRIDLNITHEGIAELVVANRSTITACLKQLRDQGYLWKEGRKLVILPPEHIEILDSLSRAVVNGDEPSAVGWARQVVKEEVDPLKALDALTSGMRQVDLGFMREELALPDVVMAAFAMKSAMPIVEAEIRRTGQEQRSVGTVVIGTVWGDIHDIGKTMVSMFLVADGFRVIDLGVNVTAEAFLDAVRTHQPDILAMSALMTITAPEQIKVVNTLKQEGLRDKVKIIVGGGAITRELADKIGADGYDPTAKGAVGLAKRLRRVA